MKTPVGVHKRLRIGDHTTPVWTIPQSIVASPLALSLDSIRVKLLNELRRVRANGGPWTREYSDGEQLLYIQCSAITQCFTGHAEELAYREEARMNRERISRADSFKAPQRALSEDVTDEWLDWALRVARRVVEADRRSSGLPEYVDEKRSVALEVVAGNQGATLHELRRKLDSALRSSRRWAWERHTYELVDDRKNRSSQASGDSIFGTEVTTSTPQGEGRLRNRCNDYACREYVIASSLYRLRLDLNALNTEWEESEIIHLALQGYGQADIGMVLGISQPTVSKYLGFLIPEAA